MNTSVKQAEPEFLSIREVAERLGVSHMTVRRRVAEGELPAVRLGGEGTSIRVPRAALDAWLWSEADAEG